MHVVDGVVLCVVSSSTHIHKYHMLCAFHVKTACQADSTRFNSHTQNHYRYMGALRQLVSKAALQDDVDMLSNPYRHISTMIDVKFITC